MDFRRSQIDIYETLSENTNIPLDELKDAVEYIYNDNQSLVDAIRQKREFIKQKRITTAALLMERNWYLRVIKKLEDAVTQDERLKTLADILEAGDNERGE